MDRQDGEVTDMAVLHLCKAFPSEQACVGAFESTAALVAETDHSRWTKKINHGSFFLAIIRTAPVF